MTVCSLSLLLLGRAMDFLGATETRLLSSMLFTTSTAVRGAQLSSSATGQHRPLCLCQRPLTTYIPEHWKHESGPYSQKFLLLLIICGFDQWGACWLRNLNFYWWSLPEATCHSCLSRSKWVHAQAVTLAYTHSETCTYTHTYIVKKQNSNIAQQRTLWHTLTQNEDGNLVKKLFGICSFWHNYSLFHSKNIQPIMLWLFARIFTRQRYFIKSVEYNWLATIHKNTNQLPHSFTFLFPTALL